MIISEHKKDSACILNTGMQNLPSFLSFWLSISRLCFLNKKFLFSYSDQVVYFLEMSQISEGMLNENDEVRNSSKKWKITPTIWQKSPS